MLSNIWKKEQLFADNPDKQVMDLLGEIPGRWGRMSPLSRYIIIEVAEKLQKEGLLKPGQKLAETGKIAGLIGATQRGSLHTDQAFIETMNLGAGLASPALFGYTLPNIALAEAAVMFGLIGPVYAIFDVIDPLKAARQEAYSILQSQENLDLMLACEFDHYHTEGTLEKCTVTLTVVKKDDNCNPSIS